MIVEGDDLSNDTFLGNTFGEATSNNQYRVSLIDSNHVSFVKNKLVAEQHTMARLGQLRAGATRHERSAAQSPSMASAMSVIVSPLRASADDSVHTWRRSRETR